MVENEVEEAEVIVDVCSLDIFAWNPEKEGVEEGIVVCQGFYDGHFANVTSASANRVPVLKHTPHKSTDLIAFDPGILLFIIKQLLIILT